MPDRPITKDRVVAYVRRRARRVGYRVHDRRKVAGPPPHPAGLVEEFARTKIAGWIVLEPEAPPARVSLYVNDLEVAISWATDVLPKRNSWGEIRAFNFKLRDVWTYVGPSDRLSVRVEGKAMPILGRGMFLKPGRQGEQDFDALRDRLAENHVFSHSGRLQLSKKSDAGWQREVLDLYDLVRAAIAEAYGYDVFFVYGSLLGAVREGGMIGHDMDFDSAYISKHTDGQAAAAELHDIAFLLIERGLDVTCVRTALHIHDRNNPRTRVDLFHLYFGPAGTLQFPFGVAGTTEIPSADWQGTKEIDFCGRRGLLPVNAEQFAEHIYGAGWRSPKPGFDWTRDRTKRDSHGILPVAFGDDVHWANFYANHELSTPSRFFEAVSARADFPSTVIDLGCGDGRDAHAFGLAGRTVLGVDRAEIGVEHATRKAQGAGFGDRVRYAVGDVADVDALRALLTPAVEGADGPVAFYLRFLLQTLSEDVQDGLLGLIAELARPGDILAAEFRTDQDEALPKTFTRRHTRRFQNGPAFGTALRERYGFEVLDEQEGTGLSPYQDEDPVLYRVVARRAPA